MVTVFSTKSCYQCEATKKYLKNRNVIFEEIDVTDDTRKLKDMGFRGAPVVVTENDQWYGFRPEKLQNII
jgi:glutaredoxin-like protein NrdH